MGLEGLLYGQIKVRIDGWTTVTNFGSPYQYYSSRQEIKDKDEADELCERLSRVFSIGHNFNNIPLETLRKIADLIETP